MVNVASLTSLALIYIVIFPVWVVPDKLSSSTVIVNFVSSSVFLVQLKFVILSHVQVIVTADEFKAIRFVVTVCA